MILSLFFTNLFNQKVYFLMNLAVFISCWVCMYIMNKHIFLYCFTHKSWKITKYRFGLQKGVEIQKIIWIFEGLKVEYITILPFLFTSIHFGRICNQKRTFLCCFMHKCWKTTQCIFWLQKVVKSWIWWHSHIRNQNLYVFHFSISWGSNFFLVGSHGFHGLFGAFCVAWHG